jgi:hypothetical protein
MAVVLLVQLRPIGMQTIVAMEAVTRVLLLLRRRPLLLLVRDSPQGA